MQGHSKSDPNGTKERSVLSGLVQACAAVTEPLPVRHLGVFLLIQSNGKVLQRDVMAKSLSEAAVALGAPAGAASVISLRSGGASAMWNQGLSSESIKRRGRWSFGCYQIYVWPGHDRA